MLILFSFAPLISSTCMADKEIQKYIKQVRDEANKDMKLHLGALNELHGENLKAIREESVLTNLKLDRMEKTLGSHTKTLDSHTKTLNSHTEMIGEMKEDIQTLKIDVKEIKKDLKNKVDRKEFSALSRKVEALA